MSYNLINEPWIDVILKRGIVQSMGLIEVFNSLEEIIDICGSPSEKISTLRLLVNIAQRALNGPANEKDWSFCVGRIKDEAITYLNKNKGLFDLYGPRPFLQVAHLNGSFSKSILKLSTFISTGNNHVLFDSLARESNARVLNEAQIARGLLHAQLFSPTGTENTPVTGWIWGGKSIEKNVGAAPLNNKLVTVIEGDNLLYTIHNNLITKDTLSGKKIDFGVPVWEIDWTTQTKIELTKNIGTYLYNLVPLSRAVLLDIKSGSMIYCGGLKQPYLPGSSGKEGLPFVDPWLTVIPIKKEKERAYLTLDPNRYTWRDLPSILRLSDISSNNGPWAFKHFEKSNSTNIVVYTGGICYDKAKPVMSISWSLNVAADSLSTLRAPFSNYIKLAEDAFFMVERAIKVYRNLMDKNMKSWRSKTFEAMKKSSYKNYWMNLNSQVGIAIQEICGEDQSTNLSEKNLSPESWLDTLRKTARECFEEACELHTNNKICVYARALTILNRELYGLGRN